MKILVIDVGGSHVKLLVSGVRSPRRFRSGPRMTPQKMVAATLARTSDWTYDHISLGFPGLVVHGRIASEPRNLGTGWIGFGFAHALRRPIRIANDAAMQALGSYHGGRMLFLGLGTGLGSAMIVDGQVEPMELAHLPYKKGRTYEDYVGDRGLERLGKRRWRKHTITVIGLLRAALEPDYIVIGGGNARKLGELPAGARLGDNVNAFAGGFKLWEDPKAGGPRQRPARDG